MLKYDFLKNLCSSVTVAFADFFFPGMLNFGF